MENITKLGFGGGCHWCTEAIFQALHGVINVEQGWIASISPYDDFSEGVIVSFDNNIIPYDVLIEIHLLTHSSSNEHKMRTKYRSALYYFDDKDSAGLADSVARLSSENKTHYITQILPFQEFRLNAESQLNYYSKNKSGPFCQLYINPKISLLRSRFAVRVREDF
ncbi:peptide methionine sulfoxide reductase [Flavobacterium sp. MEB061]|uniref:peptide-methionine (S)-S-oxide reductase n=1 Tax=Flavobacterium sp. MEB061 TaxID=1587524 RepID=UPI0005AC9BE2|nr:peptide-methionine (S)-S-oxide reductase [Flavobacterium sp. MEB061]KIQ20156.1 peptide methionine sulfoxide reductase [Flavobacterium sp. MEB061]